VIIYYDSEENNNPNKAGGMPNGSMRVKISVLNGTLMTKYEGRSADLKSRVNKHFKKITGQDRDFFSNLTQNDLMELKTVLADINNLLTFQMTIAAANWIFEYFNIDETTRLKNIASVDNTKPNSKGFDILILDPYKIIAEVKCISPVNNGRAFGVAQHDSIMNDVHKLIHGKGKIVDTTKFFKFLFLIDLEDRSDQAITQLLKETKGTTPAANKYNGLKKDKIILLNDDKLDSLNLRTVYLKKLKINK
jgi:hypothetical protein